MGQKLLVAVDTDNYLFPPAVQAAYLANVDERIEDAVADVPGLAQAVADKVAPLTSDGQVAPLVTNPNSLLRANLDNRYQVHAPPPSGGDDTAMLQTLATAAAATGGTLVLGAGTYKANLLLPDNYQQATIVGQGARFTILQAYDKTKPGIKFRGGSGGVGGGGVRDLTIRAHPDGGTDALVFSGCCHMRVQGVVIDALNSAQWSAGVVFWNEEGGDFTEFCTFEGVLYSCNQPVEYRQTTGSESFHGSGIVGNTVINMPSTKTGPVVWIRGTSLPYNAPMSFTTFFSGYGQYLFLYEQTTGGRNATFYGNIRIEGNGNQPANWRLAQGPNARILYMGEVCWFGSGAGVLGDLYLVNKVSYEGGNVWPEYKPVTARATLKNTPTVFLQYILRGSENGLLSVTIQGPNYLKSWVLLVNQSPFNGGGAVSILATLLNIDNAGIGNPTFSWGDSGLYIANGSFSNQFIASGTLSPLGGMLSLTNLPQNVTV